MNYYSGFPPLNHKSLCLPPHNNTPSLGNHYLCTVCRGGRAISREAFHLARQMGNGPIASPEGWGGFASGAVCGANKLLPRKQSYVSYRECLLLQGTAPRRGTASSESATQEKGGKLQAYRAGAGVGQWLSKLQIQTFLITISPLPLVHQISEQPRS